MPGRIGQVADKWKEGKIKMSKVEWMKWNNSGGGRNWRHLKTDKPRIVTEETNLKIHSESATLTTQEVNFASCFWGNLTTWGTQRRNQDGGKFGDLLLPRAKMLRMLGLESPREWWPLNPGWGSLSDGGQWGIVDLPEAEPGKRSQTQHLEALSRR